MVVPGSEVLVIFKMHHYDEVFKNAVTFERKEIFPIRKNQKCAEFEVAYPNVKWGEKFQLIKKVM